MMMKTMILPLVLVFVLQGCREDEPQQPQQPLNTASIYGTWQHTSHGALVIPHANEELRDFWIDIENGYTLEIRANNTFVVSNRSNDCSEGAVILTKDQISLHDSCGDYKFNYAYSYVLDQKLILSPLGRNGAEDCVKELTLWPTTGWCGTRSS